MIKNESKAAMNREIILDTETTGMNPKMGDKLVEIAALELENKLPTGRFWHRQINPEREVPLDASKVHGLTTQMLKDKPRFAELAHEFLEFIGDDPLVIHNAPFDLAFLDYELQQADLTALSQRHKIIDTLVMARRKYPGASNSLDGLCDRFEIDKSEREKHGALIDCQLLAQVYLELCGGRQYTMLAEAETASYQAHSEISLGERAARLTPRPPRPLGQASEAEKQRHFEFIKTLPNAIWQRYLKPIMD